MKFKLALAAALVLLLAAKTPVFGDYTALAGLLSVLALGGVIWRVLPGSKSASPARAMSGTRRIEIHTHGGHGTRTAARHEAGHRRMAKALGWKVHSAEIFPDGSGVTRLDVPKNAPVEHHVAIDVSGGIAAGTWAGCSSDLKYVREDLRRVPARDRARVRRAGYALARKTVGGWIFDGGVGSDAAKIYQNGRING
jgi:hypothetical protein